MAGIEWADDKDVTKADLEGVTSGYTPDQISYWVGRAKRAILSEAPADVLLERITVSKVDEFAPADVQIDLVLSKLGNPGGIRTVQETNGPSSGSVTYGGETPGQLSLTSHHRRMLGVSTAGRRASRTVPTWR